MSVVSQALAWKIPRYFIVLIPLVVVLTVAVGAWAILFVAIPPSRQEFPLIDDWSFTKLAIRMARGHGFKYDGWPSMPLLGQCLWAMPFIRLLGDSFVVTRISTLLLTGISLVALYDLLKSEPGISSESAAFGTAAFAFNPFFFIMSGTFMTDVPALAFSLISLALVRRAAVSGNSVAILAGGLAAILAATTRQNAVAAPLAMALFPAKDPVARRKAWGFAVLLPLAACLAAALWFSLQPKVNVRSTSWPTSEHITDMLLRHDQILGLSAVPLLVLRPRRMINPVFLFWLAVVGIWTWGWIYFNNLWYRQPYLAHIQPLAGDIIRATGIYFHGSWSPWADPVIRVSLTVIGCFGLAGMIAGTGGSARIGPAGWAILLFTGIHLLLMSMTRPVYDRYTIVLLPCLVLRMIPRREPGPGMSPRWRFGMVALGLLVAGSISLMHDWLTWNAARWELGRRAIARGVDPEDIEGGLEWNGWHASKIRIPTGIETPSKNLTIGFTRDIFPNVRGHYAFDIPGLGWGLPPSLRPDTITLDEVDYKLWLKPNMQRMGVVKLKESIAPDDQRMLP